MRKAHVWATLVWVALFIVSGCGGPAANPEVNTEASPEVNAIPATPASPLAGPQQPASPLAGPVSLPAGLATGNNAFAFDLYQAIRSKDGNLFLSPYSIETALGMVYAGARGETAQQMAATLHFPLPQEQLHLALGRLQANLQQAGADGSFVLTIANSLWSQRGFDLLPEFVTVAIGDYGAAPRPVDFTTGAGRDQARLAINEWVDEETQGRITDLIPDGAFNDMTRLVLANAIYFKADWDEPFQTIPDPQPFTLLSGEQIAAPMMSRRGGVRYFAAQDSEAIELSYQGDRMKMLILLPAAGQFPAFEEALDAARIEEALAGLQGGDIRLTMPKFEYTSDFMLAEPLAALGMPAAFSAAQADFSGMTGQPGLFLSAVIHKAFVAVDELGTEAAAATGVVVELSAMPQVVVVDRPFVFLIRDSETGVILFLGRVLNPVS
jgi:serpin B